MRLIQPCATPPCLPIIGSAAALPTIEAMLYVTGARGVIAWPLCCGVVQFDKIVKSDDDFGV